MQEKSSGEIRFPEDMPLLSAMCSSEQIWRFVSRKLQESELYKAWGEVITHRESNSVEISEVLLTILVGEFIVEIK